MCQLAKERIPFRNDAIDIKFKDGLNLFANSVIQDKSGVRMKEEMLQSDVDFFACVFKSHVNQLSLTMYVH